MDVEQVQSKFEEWMKENAMEVMVKVTIPDPAYELACDYMRAPKGGDAFVSQDGKRIVVASHDWKEDGIRVIVRPAWKWPEWLLSEYISQESDGTWWAFDGELKLEDDGWEEQERLVQLSRTTFTPPPCDDWKTSLRRNPNISKDQR